MGATTIQPLNASNTSGGASPDNRGIAIRAVQGEGEATYIALGALRLDERNVRKDEPTEEEIDELADLLESQGVLQNLVVVSYGTPVRGKGKDKKRAYTHGVIAGGRRLRALLRLVKRGRITLDEQVLCTVVPAERAIAASTAENSGRKPMSAADTIVAFAEMVKAGAGVEDLAVCFHLSPLTVQRRLRLANVSPALFAMFREGAMTLDQLMALALTDDHAKQVDAWNAAQAHDRSPRRLRALIAGEGVSAAVVRFVGLEAYEAAGGGALRDLFADTDEKPAYILNPVLMMKMATEKMEAIAQGLRAEGAPWVEQFLSWGYSESERFTSPPTIRRQPTAEEAASLAALEAEAEKVSVEIDALYDSDEDSDESQGKLEALEAQSTVIAEKIAAIEDGLGVVVPELASLVGAVVRLDLNGVACIERNLMRKADAVVAKRMAANASAGLSGTVALPQADQKGGVSDRLCHQLTAHRTRALQASLLGNQTVALAALVHPLLTRVVYEVGAMWDSPSAVQAKAEDCESQLKTWAPDLAESRAEKVVQDALAEARAMLPEQPADLLPWLLVQPVDTLMRLLTLCSALAFNAINGNGKHETTAAIASVVKLDMADWWAPTVTSYFGAVSKALIAQAVKEAGMPEGAEALSKLKKGEAAAKAEELLAGKRWVPTVLR
jgi:ParB family transcriptional regulator, chromosome partitioning protein